MADVNREPMRALEGIAAPGRYGKADTAPGVEARETTGFELATVTARKSGTTKLAEVVHERFGIALPTIPRRVDGAELSLIWSGPEQWLAMRAASPKGGIEPLLRTALAPHASVADQSHSRIIVRLSGRHVRDALAKGCPIDLHPAVFSPGCTAMTQIAHIGVQIWQLDSAPTYEIAAHRSFAVSLWRWIELATAEYGLQLTC